jgi:hypothetical protein
MTMATVNSEQSVENMEYVRRLLKQKQPGFSAALESAVDLVGRELESPTCCATSALPSLDPPTNSWTGGNDVSKSRLRSTRGCLAAHLSCCQPTLAAYSGHEPADDQPAVIAWLFMVNAVFGTSATKCKRQRPAAELIVPDRARVADRFQARWLIAMMTAPRFGSVFYCDQEPAPTRWTAPQ